jgi:Domain of unknown function (DUF4123)/FHA domain
MSSTRPEQASGDLVAGEVRRVSRFAVSPVRDGSAETGLALAMLEGPLAGRSLVVLPGESVRIGRSPRAGFPIPEDPLLASIHLAVEWRDGVYRVVDLGSPNGTFLNGIRIQEARLREGDRIEAGQSAFQVTFQRSPVERPPSAQDAVQTVAQQRGLSPPGSTEIATCEESPFSDLSPVERRLLELLGAGADNLFALVDTDANPAAPHCIARSGHRYGEVWPESIRSGLEKRGPYLVELPGGSTLLQTLVRHGWGRNWIVWLSSGDAIDLVLRHLRDVSSIRTASGQRLQLRIADPRLLRAFLRHLTAKECAGFFGPVTRFLLESPDCEALLDFRAAETGVVRGETALR